MNYEQRREVVLNSNDGNHINGDAPDHFEQVSVMVKCPTCGDDAPEQDIKSTGECQHCVEDFYRKNFTEGK